MRPGGAVCRFGASSIGRIEGRDSVKGMVPQSTRETTGQDRTGRLGASLCGKRQGCGYGPGQAAVAGGSQAHRVELS